MPLAASLAGLAERLVDTVGRGDLLEATEPTRLAALRKVVSDRLSIDGVAYPSPIPRVVLTLPEPVDAATLCEAWGISGAVAVSGDVHQRTWSLVRAGADLPDDHQHRIAVAGITMGRWAVRPSLVARPTGPLPDLVAGASPAYDIASAPGLVGTVEIRVEGRETRIRFADHPDVIALQYLTAARHSAWHRSWQLAPGARLLVVDEGGDPLVAAAVRQDPGLETWMAGPFLVGEGATPEAGSSLLDGVEAWALREGGRRVVLDDSVLVHPRVLRPQRHGYSVAPEYAGDPDAPLWLEKPVDHEPMHGSGAAPVAG